MARLSDTIYIDYVQQIHPAYRDAMADVRTLGYTDPRFQAIVLWNHQLFFELHELLETIWVGSREPDRSALKGWIQAAGAFVHHRRGKSDAACGLAGRARKYLVQCQDVLGFIGNLDVLIDALGPPLGEPPQLELAAQ